MAALPGSTLRPSRTQCHEDRLSQHTSQCTRFLIILPNTSVERTQNWPFLPNFLQKDLCFDAQPFPRVLPLLMSWLPKTPNSSGIHPQHDKIGATG